MTHEERDTFLAKANDAIIGVNRPNGAPQLTPVWFAWDGAAFIFTTTTARAKYTYLKRDPAISIIVNDQVAHKYILAYGTAELIHGDIADAARPILVKHVPADKLEQRVQAIRDDPTRFLVRLHPTKMISSF